MARYKYNKINKNGTEYFRHTFTIEGHKYDVIAKTEKLLEEKIDKIKYEVKSGDTINSPNLNVATWAIEWLEVYKKPTIINTSYKLYETNIKKYIIPEIGNMKLCDIQPIHLQRILTSQSGMSFSHVSHLKNTIKGMFDEAYNNGYINRNPSINLVMPTVVKGTHRCITNEEEKYLFKVCEYHYMGLYPLMMYYCGLRPGECSALLWGDIDIDKKMININKAVESHTRNIKEPKTKSGIRDIPIPEVLIEILKEKKLNKTDKDFVFVTGQGNMCTVKYLHDCWLNIIRLGFFI